MFGLWVDVSLIVQPRHILRRLARVDVANPSVVTSASGFRCPGGHDRSRVGLLLNARERHRAGDCCGRLKFRFEERPRDGVAIWKVIPSISSSTIDRASVELAKHVHKVADGATIASEAHRGKCLPRHLGR
jgi:hypothetical protein